MCFKQDHQVLSVELRDNPRSREGARRAHSELEGGQRFQLGSVPGCGSPAESAEYLPAATLVTARGAR